jgi:putative NIF3 family GTP cyclohydrolase 1 type 2
VFTDKLLETLLKTKPGWKKISARFQNANKRELMRFYHFYKDKSKENLCEILRTELNNKNLIALAPSAKIKKLVKEPKTKI